MPNISQLQSLRLESFLIFFYFIFFMFHLVTRCKTCRLIYDYVNVSVKDYLCLEPHFHATYSTFCLFRVINFTNICPNPRSVESSPKGRVVTDTLGNSWTQQDKSLLGKKTGEYLLMSWSIFTKNNKRNIIWESTLSKISETSQSQVGIELSSHDCLIGRN